MDARTVGTTISTPLNLATPSQPRDQTLDLLRGIAVVLMLQQHLMAWMWNLPWRDLRGAIHAFRLTLGINGLGGLAAPLFVLVAGAGAAVALKPGKPRTKTVTRGLIVLCAGYVLNMSTPSWFALPSWYILHLIGFCLIVAPARFAHKPRVAALTGAAVILATPLMQHLMGTPLASSYQHMNTAPHWTGFLKRALTDGYFPVFPWSGLFFIGMAVSPAIRARRWGKILTAGLCLCAAGALASMVPMAMDHHSKGSAIYRYVAMTSRIYPVFLPLLLIITGSSLIICSVACLGKRPQGAPHLPSSWIAATGRCSLSIFFVHILVFKEIAARGGWYKQLDLPVAWISVITIIAAVMALSVFWDRRGRIGGLEWMERLILQKIISRSVSYPEKRDTIL